jgi:hypothetical protein
MTPLPPLQTQLTVAARAQCLDLRGAQSIIGVASPRIMLQSLDGAITFTCPQEVFPNVQVGVGEPVIVTISLVKVGVTPVPAEVLP